jgi:glyoxylase-like metal-dependent hydrolase (beta-lactamase superfamily II)
MMLARPPGGDAGAGESCARHPRLRRWLWLAWLAVVLGVALVFGHGVAAEFEPVGVKVTPKRLTPRVWFVQGDSGAISAANQGFNSNAGFVVTDEGVVVFDVLGTPALGAEYLKKIREITDRPIRRIVVSHYHADHFYGLQAFKAVGAEVTAHQKVRDYLATDAPAARLAERRQSLFPWVNEASRVVPPDRYLGAEEVFRLGGVTFRVFHVGPAHTPEDLMMLVEEEGVLFAGDLMFAGRVPFVGDADSRAWLAAIEKLVERKPRVVVGGHGPASTDAATDLALTRDYLRFLRAEMGRAVQEMTPFEEAYASTDWSRFRGIPAFEAANRRNAYNTYLLMEKEALGK